MEDARIYMEAMRCFRVFSNPMLELNRETADSVVCQDGVVVEQVELDGLELVAIEFPEAA